MPPQDKHRFHSVDAAIRVLRIGKKDPRWVDAAEFLIERAAPDVRLMLEAAQELERRDIAAAEHAGKAASSRGFATLFSPAQWVVMVLMAATFSGLMFWIVNNATLRGC